MTLPRAAVGAAHAAVRPLAGAVAAELIKLRGLPIVLATAFGTATAAAAFAAALAATAPLPVATATSTAAATPTQVLTQTVLTQTIVFIQAGTILLGVLVVGTEYAGRQIATTLTAIPNRLLLLAGKTVAYLITATTTSAIAVGAGLCTARITLTARHINATLAADTWHILEAGAYLVLIGLLALALTAVLRSLIAALVTMLAVVFVVAPLLAGYTELAGYLPGAFPLPQTATGAGTGIRVLVAWIATLGVMAVAAFQVRDA